MKIKLKRTGISQLTEKISVPLFLMLLLNQLLPKYYFILVSVLLYGYFIINRRFHMPQFTMSGKTMYYLMVAIGFFAGSIAFCFGENGFWPFFRDCIHIALVYLYWQNGFLIANKSSSDSTKLYATIFIFAGTSLFFINLSALAEFVTGAIGGAMFIRQVHYNEMLVAIGTFTCIVPPKDRKEAVFGMALDRFLRINIFISFFLSFSRTTVLFLACLVLCSDVMKRVRQLGKLVIICIAGITLVSVFMPEVLDVFMQKVFRTVVELSSQDINWTKNDVVQNWRGYEVYCAQQTFSSYGIIEKLFGRGFGATVDVGSYAYLVTSEETLPYLHNGYYTTIIKLGIFGLILNILYQIALVYKFHKMNMNVYDKRLCIGIILCMVISAFVFHGELYGDAHFICFAVLAWNSIKHRKLYCLDSISKEL